MPEIRSRLAICSALHEEAQRRSCRRPWRRPIQRTSGRATAAPSATVIMPASQSCTYWRRASFTASFATFGRRAPPVCSAAVCSSGPKRRRGLSNAAWSGIRPRRLNASSCPLGSGDVD
jgi:hypothetical protein